MLHSRHFVYWMSGSEGDATAYKAISSANLSFPISSPLPQLNLYCALTIDFLENLSALAKYPAPSKDPEKASWQPGTLFLQIFLNLFRQQHRGLIFSGGNENSVWLELFKEIVRL